MNKVDYVLSQGQTRDHICHYPGCERQVPPAMFMCRKHWYSLPKDLQRKIWKAYEPGQEVNMTPSEEYLAVVDEVMKWIAANGAPNQGKLPL